jgi:hypothetical protein
MGNSRFIITLLLALVSAAQSLVVVSAPCYVMTGADVLSSMESTDPAHAGHHMAGDTVLDGAASDCCDGGYCSISGCSSLMALADVFVPGSITGPRSAGDPLPSSSPTRLSESLFRPPISG